MQFRNNIIKQASGNSNSNSIKQQEARNNYQISFADRKEGFYQRNFIGGLNQISQKHTQYTRESTKITQSKIQGNLDKKEENWLTDQERKIVGDIGKLFSSQTSKPTKLLIRLNQTQSNKINKSGQQNSISENRLQKIQVTRLDGNNNQASHLKKTNENTFQFNKQLQNDRQSQTEPQLQSSLQSIKSSSVKIYHSSQLITQPQQKFNITKQISIMFVPNLTQISYRNSGNFFNKFNKKNTQSKLQSVNSNYSNDFQEDKNIEQDLPQASNYVKLLQVQLFMRKQQIRLQRSQQLRQANEKLLSAHLFSKEQLQKAKIFIQRLQIQYKTKFEQLKSQLQQQTNLNKQLTIDIQTKQKSIEGLHTLNQQFLKENNLLKQTIKENIKTIRELKYQISNKQKERLIVMENHRNENKKISFLKNENQYGYNMHRSPRRQNRQEPSLNSPSNANPTSYTPTQINQKPSYQFYRNDKIDVNQAKLTNCRSQGVLYPSQVVKKQLFIKDNPIYQPTSRSHKNVGIKRNNLNQQPISPSTRNLVRINKNMNDGSILIGQKIKDNKSLSNFSHLSGKSLSQRVGYIAKPTVNDKKNGILVDYMIQNEIKPKQQPKLQKKSQRFKFKAQ